MSGEKLFLHASKSVKCLTIGLPNTLLIPLCDFLRKGILIPPLSNQLLKRFFLFAFARPNSFVCRTQRTCILTHIELIDAFTPTEHFAGEFRDCRISAPTADEVDASRLRRKI